MLKERRLAADTVAEKLFAAESAIDAAVMAIAQLTAAIPMVSRDANLPPHVGQEAIMHAMETATQLIRARSNIICTHDALSVAQRTIGLGSVHFGPTGIGSMKAPQAETTAPVRHLAAVAA